MKKTHSKQSSSGIVPLHDRVVVREIGAEDAERKTESGIIIPVTVKEDKGAKRGRVIAKGPGRYEDGKLLPMGVAVGDTVLFQWGDEVTIDGEKYSILRESEIIAIIK